MTLQCNPIPVDTPRTPAYYDVLPDGTCIPYGASPPPQGDDGITMSYGTYTYIDRMVDEELVEQRWGRRGTR